MSDGKGKLPPTPIEPSSYGAIDSFTAAFPRGQLGQAFDDDDDDDLTDPGPTTEGSLDGAAARVLPVTHGRDGVSLMYLGVAVVGGGMLAASMAGLLVVAWYLM